MIIFSVWLVEKVGRRNGLIWGAFIGSLPMWYIGGYVMKADPAGNSAAGNIDQNGWGYLAMGTFGVISLPPIPRRVRLTKDCSVRISLRFNLLRYLAGYHLGILLRNLPNRYVLGIPLLRLFLSWTNQNTQISVCSAQPLPPPTSGSGASSSPALRHT